VLGIIIYLQKIGNSILQKIDNNYFLEKITFPFGIKKVIPNCNGMHGNVHHNVNDIINE
jgi:hypothetical protein